jgi:hypothetical protein
MCAVLEQDGVVGEFADEVRLESFISTSRLKDFTDLFYRCSQRYMPCTETLTERPSKDTVGISTCMSSDFARFVIDENFLSVLSEHQDMRTASPRSEPPNVYSSPALM